MKYWSVTATHGHLQPVQLDSIRVISALAAFRVGRGYLMKERLMEKRWGDNRATGSLAHWTKCNHGSCYFTGQVFWHETILGASELSLSGRPPALTPAAPAIGRCGRPWGFPRAASRPSASAYFKLRDLDLKRPTPVRRGSGTANGRRHRSGDSIEFTSKATFLTTEPSLLISERSPVKESPPSREPRARTEVALNMRVIIRAESCASAAHGPRSLRDGYANSEICRTPRPHDRKCSCSNNVRK
ncbi:hypothetical protein EVAR_53678_1 [Eumeta japonica]|uniref:Uncharacterized protein n=1 Tax=Eumeta variegata TaxID=151549 RepID=A0A4C1YPW3_EUMVA|nr:hypothetical protein EVAR_53678_1 [Eumeta japonica]